MHSAKGRSRPSLPARLVCVSPSTKTGSVSLGSSCPIKTINPLCFRWVVLRTMRVPFRRCRCGSLRYSRGSRASLVWSYPCPVLVVWWLMLNLWLEVLVRGVEGSEQRSDLIEGGETFSELIDFLIYLLLIVMYILQLINSLMANLKLGCL